MKRSSTLSICGLPFVVRLTTPFHKVSPIFRQSGEFYVATFEEFITASDNILIRGILGERVPQLLQRYGNQVQFFTAAVCYEEARRHLPAILEKRGIEPAPFLKAIDVLETVVVPLSEEIYGAFETQAKQRIAARDKQDWPLLALALALDCPVWSEDNDFFGTGVATWNSQNVEIYLRG